MLSNCGKERKQTCFNNCPSLTWNNLYDSYWYKSYVYWEHSLYYYPYVPYGPQTQCFNCQQYGHPKAFCENPAVCAVCAKPYLTISHECISKICKGGPVCTHPFTIYYLFIYLSLLSLCSCLGYERLTPHLF
jgi:hypothetical protein